MSIYDKFIEGFFIFKKYDHNHGISASHDIIYAGPDPEAVSAEDLEKLETLGWNREDEEGCFYRFL